jgi:hypothetical protein
VAESLRFQKTVQCTTSIQPLSPWWCRHYASLKHRSTSVWLHGATADSKLHTRRSENLKSHKYYSYGLTGVIFYFLLLLAACNRAIWICKVIGRCSASYIILNVRSRQNSPRLISESVQVLHKRKFAEWNFCLVE